MPVLEGYENADTPHAKTVMAPGWTYGCHSSKVGDKPRGGLATYPVIDGFSLGNDAVDDNGVECVQRVPLLRLHTTHWLDTRPDGSPLKCGHMEEFRLTDPQCIGCANRE